MGEFKNSSVPNFTPYILRPLTCYINIYLQEGEHHRHPSEILSFMNEYCDTFLDEVNHLCLYRSQTESENLIYRVRQSIIIFKDDIHQHMKARRRNKKDVAGLQVIYACLGKLNRKIEQWFYSFCKIDVKVPDKVMEQERHQLHTQYRKLKCSLQQHFVSNHLVEMTLTPVRSLLNKKQQPVETRELQHIQQYLDSINSLFPETAINKKNERYNSMKNNSLEQRIQASLKQYNYYIPPETEEAVTTTTPETTELPPDSKTGRSVRLILNQSVTFIGALIRVLKEVDFIGNTNMSELRRLLAIVIQPTTTDKTTEEALDIAYRNLNVSTCQKLIVLLERCIQWLKKHVRDIKQDTPQRRK